MTTKQIPRIPRTEGVLRGSDETLSNLSTFMAPLLEQKFEKLSTLKWCFWKGYDILIYETR